MYTHQERQLLLRIARNAIAHALGMRRDVPAVPDGAGPLAAPAGAFVTLRLEGELRGCIGYVDAVRPLAGAVSEVAVRAALYDPRFPPLTRSELPHVEIEISVLSPLRRILGESEVEVGVHGLVIECRGARGLLLPQVAVEQGWDRRRFLEYTSVKAGLPPEAWKDPEAQLFSFTADVFAESSLEGAHP